MERNKAGLWVFVLGILLFLGPLMLTWLGFLLSPELAQFMANDVRSCFLVAAGALLIVVGGSMNSTKDKEASK